MPLISYRFTPPFVTGNYFLPISDGAASTSGALGDGTLRVAPWVLDATVTLDRLAVDINTAGQAASKFRLGIWADNGSNYPGALLVDAGQVAADATGLVAATVALTLGIGRVWIGGAVQAAATTQPVVRIVSAWNPRYPLPLGTSAPAAGAVALGYQSTGVSGAFAGVFPGGATVAATIPRLFARAA